MISQELAKELQNILKDSNIELPLEEVVRIGSAWVDYYDLLAALRNQPGKETSGPDPPKK